ncbi:MAG: TonB-dependent receptor [Cytophagales bacterium]
MANFYNKSLFLLFVFFVCQIQAQSKFTISGYVKDNKNGEDLIGATVMAKNTKYAVATNEYGFFSLTMPEGEYVIVIQYIGYKNIEKSINLNANQKLNFSLQEDVKEMEEVVITEKKPDDNVSNIKMSSNTLDIKQIKNLPALFGEVDIIKNIQTLPGIQNAGEGTTGFFVRGGGADQNLILLDEAPVYNASHLLGFFSVFNADAVKSAEIYKGGIPAQYGGRLSSLLDIRTKDGNNKKFGGIASIGLISSKVSLEGPLKKEKSSFFVSARRTYVDMFLKLSPNPQSRSNQLYFYDINAKMNFNINEKNRIFIAGYFGRDVLKFGVFGLNWGNGTGTFRWNHLFNDRLFSNTTLIYSNFNYGLGIRSGAVGFDWTSNLKETALKQDFTYFLNPQNELKFGAVMTYRTFQPGKITPSSAGSVFSPIQLDQYNAGEMAIYASNDQKLGARWHLQYGLRYTIFSQMGNSKVFKYNGDRRRENIVDTLSYGAFQPIKTYGGLEPRLALRYTLNTSSSIKSSYNRTYQFLHLLSQSTIPLPTAVWIPSTQHILPQYADQVAVGYFKNLFDNKIETSVETYYKEFHDVTDFKDNSDILLNPHVETEVRQGKGWSYGIEFFVKKNSGKLTGWISYTLSKAERQIADVNGGERYRADYDRRHNANLVASYELTPKWNISGAWVYSTGRPMSLPAGFYDVGGYNVPLYTERNGYVMPAFHRLDFSATKKWRSKKNEKIEKSFNISFYNLYNRKNPFIVTVDNENDSNGRPIENKKVINMYWLFPILPSISYQISF